MKQLKLLKSDRSNYGGELFKTRKGRSRPRPLSTHESIHLVLRSSRAQGNWSFTRHRPQIHELTLRFARRYGVRVYSYANVGNHLHFHLKLSNRFLYAPFIRALTGAIAMAVTGTSRWKPLKGKFWDYRPFTRVIRGLRAILGIRDYIQINQLEGFGFTRSSARFHVECDRLEWDTS
jgi:hypothetical protein